MFMADIRQIKAFVAVAEELNFHRAAEKLGTVQPALSRLIRNLEIDLKVKLFERTTRHVALTETGKLFLGEAHALIAQLANAVRAAQSTEKGESGTLTLAYMDFAVHALLPELLASVAKAGPGIGFQLIYMSTAQQRLALTEGKIDMGMMIGQMSNPLVDCLRIASERLTVVLPSGHRLAAKNSVKLADILGEPVLLGNEVEWSAFREIIFRLYAQQGANPRIGVEASSAAALFGLVTQGLGISFYAGVPKIYQSGSLVFRPLVPAETVPISLVWRKGPKLALVRQVLKVAGWSKS
jgi:LysR family transcriptional regulator, benzoate and cis,cis-muconate-responsive activator of ben and cat genes